ncbi:MAG: hypothetical protein NC299_09195 [Lachnospiraceae bacterium]|nr:hypothetical protein [Ruminococcus sp.]MCM1275528.1 hypothetical protein [Lachnospiraceae bacterium]
MKHIVAFVLLGIVTYAGISFAASGIRIAAESSRTPIALTGVPQNEYIAGMSVGAKLDRQFGKIGRTAVRQEFLGFEFGEPLAQYYYVIPAGKITKPQEQYYMLVCASGDSAAALDGLFSEELSAVGEGAPLECSGVLVEMNPNDVETFMLFLTNNAQLIKSEELVDLVGDPSLTMPTTTNAYNHICRYVFYVHSSSSGEALPIIIGAALTLVGAGGIALVAVKLHREKTGY